MRHAEVRQLFTLTMLALCAVGTRTDAHTPPKIVTREIVQLKGYRRPDGEAPAGHMTLRALGAEHPFAATLRQAYALTVDGEEPPKVGDRYALQGPRDLLSRFGNARPAQMITILAEHRPGGGDLFILTLDLCPAK